tara:strand:- start:868 stop:1089 length:222 start_codon:yes stop_codon:yes gene_type:complete
MGDISASCPTIKIRKETITNEKCACCLSKRPDRLPNRNAVIAIDIEIGIAGVQINLDKYGVVIIPEGSSGDKK